MHFSKEEVQMAERHGKTLRITGHQGKADQNHSELPPHPCQNGHHQKEHNLPPTPTLTRTWRSEPLCPAGGKCCSHHGDHDGGFSANQHWNYHMIQIPLLGPRKTLSVQSGILYSSQNTEASQVSTDRSRRRGIYTRWNVSHEKEQDCAFATWIDLEGVMLSEVSQRKTNPVWYHL